MCHALCVSCIVRLYVGYCANVPATITRIILFKAEVCTTTLGIEITYMYMYLLDNKLVMWRRLGRFLGGSPRIQIANRNRSSTLLESGSRTETFKYPIPKAGSQGWLQQNTRFWGPTRLQFKYPVVWAPTLELRATGQNTWFFLMSHRQNVSSKLVKAPHTTDANHNVCA